ncbi:AMP-binding protein [Actibacterium pelagium]|nr:AMP-binding protein [Actibacterium pelagium]
MHPERAFDHQLRWTPTDLLGQLDRMGEQPTIKAVASGVVKEYSGVELADLIRGAAARLTDADIGRGDTVAIWAPNSAAWVSAGIACHLLGVILAPIDAMLSAEEARQQIEDSNVSTTFVAEATVQALGQNTPTILLETVEPSKRPIPDVALTADMPIALFRTSGTTGKPKKFHLSLQNIGWNVAVMSESGEFSDRDRILMPLPMHHVFPWISATLPCLTLGAALVLPESPTGPHLAEALKLTRPTILIGVPRLYEALLDAIRIRLRGISPLAVQVYESLLGTAIRLKRLSGGAIGSLLLAPIRRMIAAELRMVVSGGAHLKPSIEAEMEALGWDVRGGYGLAETSASVTAPLGGKRLGSTGRAVEGCSVRIDNPNSEGIGEILVSGPVVFSGYINNPDANTSSFTDDGYFRTGDLGRMDDDGFLFVTGRIKEVIVLSGGDNIFPEDVEAKFLTDPVIAEIGVLEKDGTLVAVIVPDMAEIARRKLINPEEIVSIAVASAAKSLPSTWRLSGFVLSREPLPRTRLLKLRRFMLPKIYDDLLSGQEAKATALSPEDKSWIAEEPQKSLWKILQQEFPDSDLSLDGYVSYELGLDSFGWMNLSLEIEKSTGVRLSLLDIAKIATIRDMFTVVAERLEAGPDDTFTQADSTAAVEKWLSQRSRSETALGWLLYLCNSLIMRVYFRVRSEGRENLSKLGDAPFLICPNHVSDLDALVLAASLPSSIRHRTMWSGSRGAAFGTGFRRAVARSVGMFPVDQEAPMIAIDIAVEALNRGMVQVWFPEGLLSPDGKLLPFHVGVGHIIARSEVPVVPVIIKGTFEALPRERRIPRPKAVRIIFGSPIDPKEFKQGSKSSESDEQFIANKLRQKLLDLAADNGADLRSHGDA